MACLQVLVGREAAGNPPSPRAASQSGAVRVDAAMWAEIDVPVSPVVGRGMLGAAPSGKFARTPCI